jgi:hypothetical protein
MAGVAFIGVNHQIRSAIFIKISAYIHIVLTRRYTSKPLYQCKQYHRSGNIDKYAIGVYYNSMEFIETSIFTRLITSLLPDDE